jgi:hypothetical protein
VETEVKDRIVLVRGTHQNYLAFKKQFYRGEPKMYTVFALNPHNEHLDEALLVDSKHLAGACDALINFWEVQQAENDHHETAVVGVHRAVYQDLVRDGRNWKPLPWVPGEPVVDTNLVTEV